MAEDDGRVCCGNIKCWLCVFPILALAQLTMNCFALAMPRYIVGNITVLDAATFADDRDKFEASENLTSLSNASYVQVQIGLFHSFISGFFDGSNREGMVAVFGFALMSTISALFTFLYAIKVYCKCCDDTCGKCCIKLSVNLASFARANFSSGVSDVAVAGMVAFTAEDISGNSFGSSFVLTIFSSVAALINNFIKDCVNSHVRKKASGQDINVDNVI